MADHFFGITDTGKARDNNEDAFIAQEIMNQKFILACVIDGVGGYSGGEIAADIARESILEQFTGFSDDLVSRMKDSFKLAAERIQKEKEEQPHYAKMACVLTLALVDIENNQFHYAHLGDTRLYLFRDNSLIKVSKDHSFVGFLEESGRLTEEAAMQHPKRNEINKALGLGENLSGADDYIETGESPFLPQDLLLLCSDGLTDMVNKNEICTILSGDASLEEKGTQLIAAANRKGGKDNITAVLVQNNKQARKPEVTKPGAPFNMDERPKPVVEIPRVEVPKPAEKIAPPAAPRKKRNMGMIWFLSILSLILLGTTLFLFWRNLKLADVKDESPAEMSEMASSSSRNENELKLQDAINAVSGDTLYLSASNYPGPISISDTILIQKDTLYIKTRGRIAFVADSNYTGPAMLLASSCQFISMDSLVFENFDTAISGYNHALRLRDVRFNNCRIPVETLFTFEDNQYVNGGVMNGSFKKDTIPQKSAR